MDVEENQVALAVTPSPEEQDFLDKFTPFPFTHETRDSILARRSILSDELVFDLLLEQASIASPQSLYPPDSEESLLHLLEAITACGWDGLKKACLQFYLLSHVSRNIAHEHAVSCALPPQFVHLAQACYLLDSGTPQDLERAVSLLSDARIVQDLSPKILQILALAPYPNSSRLVRTYVRTAQPVLEDYEDLAIYLKALIDYSLVDAWSFQRTFSETSPTRNLLIRTILDSCLIPPKPAVLPHFLSIPLTFLEFSLLQSYALTPPDELSAAAHAILQNLITVRLLHSGKYSDAVRISRAFDALNAKLHPINTPMPLHKAARERQQMMRDVLAVIPEVQRRQLELELSDEQGETSTSSLSASWANASNDISMSWESLGASSNKKVVGGTRTGRLEGSPAPTLPERGSVITPFAPITPSSAQKRHAVLNADVYGSLTKEMSTRAPLFPHIPTKPLANRQTGDTSTLPMNFGFQASRAGFTPPSRPIQGFGSEVAMARSFGTGRNIRNAFYEPEPSRTGSSPFARQQYTANGPAVTPVKRVINGEQTISRTHMEKSIIEMPSATDKSPDATSRDPDDIVMVDSDDPDAFVVHGTRRSLVYLPERISDQNTGMDGIQKEKETNGAASLFRRSADTTKQPDHGRHQSENRVLPGGFAFVELEDAHPASSSSRATRFPVQEVSGTHRVRARVASPEHIPPQPLLSTRLKIPGGLFEEDAEAEEQDHVPSLFPAPKKGGRRKRTTRLNGPATDSEDDDQPRTPLRRSSRLSSTGPSPEPKKQERKVTSMRSTRSTDSTTRRKRKNTEE